MPLKKKPQSKKTVIAPRKVTLPLTVQPRDIIKSVSVLSEESKSSNEDRASLTGIEYWQSVRKP